MDRCTCRSIQTRTQRYRFNENHNFKSDFQTALYFGQSNFPRGLTPLLSLNRHSNTGIVISIVIFIILLFPAASSSEFPGRSPSARPPLDIIWTPRPRPLAPKTEPAAHGQASADKCGCRGAGRVTPQWPAGDINATVFPRRLSGAAELA